MIRMETMKDTQLAQDELQLQALLVARAYLYELFHKLLGGAPDDDVLEALLSGMTADAFEEFAGASDELRVLGGFLGGLRAEGRADLLERAKGEYTRVFIGPGALPASPYESPYTGAHDMSLFQENTLAVRSAYRESGLKARREQAVPDDHVSLLCAFMAARAKRVLDAFCAGGREGVACELRDQGAFVQAHLASWVGVFAASVRNSKAAAAAVLYPQMLEALEAFVRADVAFLTEAAYWAERQDEARAVALAPELAQIAAALEALEALRPFGIQDNELVPVE